LKELPIVWALHPNHMLTIFLSKPDSYLRFLNLAGIDLIRHYDNSNR